jgi:hypothetical protein
MPELAPVTTAVGIVYLSALLGINSACKAIAEGKKVIYIRAGSMTFIQRLLVEHL